MLAVMHLVVIGHPHRESFCHALAHAYSEGLRESGASVAFLKLAELQFDPILRAGFKGQQELEPDLQRAVALLQQAAHVAWFFPTYWGAPPALVRGFVDRAFLPGVAFRHRGKGNGLPEGLFAGRGARVVTTMDSPWLWYWLYHRGSVHGSFVNATLKYVGFSGVKTTTHYSLRKRTEQERLGYLSRMRRLGASDALPDATRELSRAS